MAVRYIINRYLEMLMGGVGIYECTINKKYTYNFEQNTKNTV